MVCIVILYVFTSIGSGRKPSPVLEQSSMVVETVEKKPGSKVTKKFHGDASKVTVRGPGIKKAFMNRAQNLTIDVKDAGMIHATKIFFPLL